MDYRELPVIKNVMIELKVQDRVRVLDGDLKKALYEDLLSKESIISSTVVSTKNNDYQIIDVKNSGEKVKITLIRKEKSMIPDEVYEHILKMINTFEGMARSYTDDYKQGATFGGWFALNNLLIEFDRQKPNNL